jgi:hypothetical protein
MGNSRRGAHVRAYLSYAKADAIVKSACTSAMREKHVYRQNGDWGERMARAEADWPNEYARYSIHELTSKEAADAAQATD